MAPEHRDLLLEIGCEELPASFVEGALRALPELARKKLAELRLEHGVIRALGTPRRIALLVEAVASQQPDLAEEMTGPPVKAAFKDGVPTKAAEAFANKLGCSVAELRRVETPKGEYLVGTRRETGRPAQELLTPALSAISLAIPFRKSMRWGAGEVAFGRPIQWLVALFGEAVVPVEVAGVKSDRFSMGHRFLAPGPVSIGAAREYVTALRTAHVLVDPEERASAMQTALHAAAAEVSGTLIEDEFLLGENLSLVEEPHVIAGGYEDEFLTLPERVILEVAKGHQRYFGVRGADGRLLPRYLSVVNTALDPAAIRKGNDRVMRARLSDARFFYREDLRVPLAERRQKLAGIVFQKRLGTVLGKAERMERLARELGLLLMLPEATIMAAASGAHLAKCDLVSLMVGEFPELQGEMGASYALAQGVSADVAAVIMEHYQPKGAADSVAPSDAGALAALADRLDTLAGCFAVGLFPTGAADPFALRRACLGVLRTLIAKGFDLSLPDAFRAAFDGYAGVKLDLSRDDLVARLVDFATERQKGLLSDVLPSDAVLAALAVSASRPLEAKKRAEAIAALDADTRAKVGEVFKRATNIAATAPDGEPTPPPATAHATEHALFEAHLALREKLAGFTRAGDFESAFREVGAFAPLLSQYFLDVFVMSEDLEERAGRLRLMRAISDTASTLAKLDLLAKS